MNSSVRLGSIPHQNNNTAITSSGMASQSRDSMARKVTTKAIPSVIVCFRLLIASPPIFFKKVVLEPKDMAKEASVKDLVPGPQAHAPTSIVPCGLSFAITADGRPDAIKERSRGEQECGAYARAVFFTKAAS